MRLFAIVRNWQSLWQRQFIRLLPGGVLAAIFIIFATPSFAYAVLGGLGASLRSEEQIKSIAGLGAPTDQNKEPEYAVIFAAWLANHPDQVAKYNSENKTDLISDDQRKAFQAMSSSESFAQNSRNSALVAKAVKYMRWFAKNHAEVLDQVEEPRFRAEHQKYMDLLAKVQNADASKKPDEALDKMIASLELSKEDAKVLKGKIDKLKELAKLNDPKSKEAAESIAAEIAQHYGVSTEQLLTAVSQSVGEHKGSDHLVSMSEAGDKGPMKFSPGEKLALQKAGAEASSNEGLMSLGSDTTASRSVGGPAGSDVVNFDPLLVEEQAQIAGGQSFFPADGSTEGSAPLGSDANNGTKVASAADTPNPVHEAEASRSPASEKPGFWGGLFGGGKAQAPVATPPAATAPSTPPTTNPAAEGDTSKIGTESAPSDAPADASSTPSPLANNDSDEEVADPSGGTDNNSRGAWETAENNDDSCFGYCPAPWTHPDHSPNVASAQGSTGSGGGGQSLSYGDQIYARESFGSFLDGWNGSTQQKALAVQSECIDFTDERHGKNDSEVLSDFQYGLANLRAGCARFQEFVKNSPNSCLNASFSSYSMYPLPSGAEACYQCARTVIGAAAYLHNYQKIAKNKDDLKGLVSGIVDRQGQGHDTAQVLGGTFRTGVNTALSWLGYAQQASSSAPAAAQTQSQPTQKSNDKSSQDTTLTDFIYKNLTECTSPNSYAGAVKPQIMAYLKAHPPASDKPKTEVADGAKKDAATDGKAKETAAASGKVIEEGEANAKTGAKTVATAVAIGANAGATAGQGTGGSGETLTQDPTHFTPANVELTGEAAPVVSGAPPQQNSASCKKKFDDDMREKVQKANVAEPTEFQKLSKYFDYLVKQQWKNHKDDAKVRDPRGELISDMLLAKDPLCVGINDDIKDRSKNPADFNSGAEPCPELHTDGKGGESEKMRVAALVWWLDNNRSAQRKTTDKMSIDKMATKILTTCPAWKNYMITAESKLREEAANCGSDVAKKLKADPKLLGKSANRAAAFEMLFPKDYDTLGLSVQKKQKFTQVKDFSGLPMMQAGSLSEWTDSSNAKKMSCGEIIRRHVNTVRMLFGPTDDNLAKIKMLSSHPQDAWPLFNDWKKAVDATQDERAPASRH